MFISFPLLILNNIILTFIWNLSVSSFKFLLIDKLYFIYSPSTSNPPPPSWNVEVLNFNAVVWYARSLLTSPFILSSQQRLCMFWNHARIYSVLGARHRTGEPATKICFVPPLGLESNLWKGVEIEGSNLIMGLASIHACENLTKEKLLKLRCDSTNMRLKWRR